jgi:hypothetical protein
MDGSKSPVQSLTIVSAAASALVSLLALCGIGIDPALANDTARGVDQLAAAVLALVAVYGRWRASVRIGRDG